MIWANSVIGASSGEFFQHVTKIQYIYMFSWSMIPALLMALPAILYRTRIEDQTLRDELMGYADYRAQVRFRLIPGVW